MSTDRASEDSVTSKDSVNRQGPVKTWTTNRGGRGDCGNNEEKEAVSVRQERTNVRKERTNVRQERVRMRGERVNIRQEGVNVRQEGVR